MEKREKEHQRKGKGKRKVRRKEDGRRDKKKYEKERIMNWGNYKTIEKKQEGQKKI